VRLPRIVGGDDVGQPHRFEYLFRHEHVELDDAGQPIDLYAAGERATHKQVLDILSAHVRCYQIFAAVDNTLRPFVSQFDKSQTLENQTIMAASTSDREVPFVLELSPRYGQRFDVITDELVEFPNQIDCEVAIKDGVSRLELGLPADDPEADRVLYLAILEVLLHLVEIGFELRKNSEEWVEIETDGIDRRRPHFSGDDGIVDRYLPV